MLCAHDFSGSVGLDGWSFGADKESSVAALRELANRIETGEVLMQSVRVTSLAHNNDFTLTGLRLVVAEKKIKELRGSESPFPVAVAR